MKPAFHYTVLSALAPLVVACSGAPDDDVAVLTAPACIEHSPTLFGIDVSKWQGTINWAQVKAGGVQYAFIRVSDGITTIDEKFPANWAGAKANNIPRGVYQFFRPNRDAIEQARIVIDHLDMYGMGELPPVIDVEATGDQTPAVVAQQVGLWIDEIETTLGVRPIIYSGSYFWDDNVKSTAFSDYPFWIAHYTSASCPRLPAAWADWTFWQYSSTGTVSGISGDCDMNRYAGTLEELLDLVPDETCRLDPDWRACSDDVASACVDGQIETSACGPGRSCVGLECAIDAARAAARGGRAHARAAARGGRAHARAAARGGRAHARAAARDCRAHTRGRRARARHERRRDLDRARRRHHRGHPVAHHQPPRGGPGRRLRWRFERRCAGLALLLALLYLLSFERTSQRPTP